MTTLRQAGAHAASTSLSWDFLERVVGQQTPLRTTASSKTTACERTSCVAERSAVVKSAGVALGKLFAEALRPLPLLIAESTSEMLSPGCGLNIEVCSHDEFMVRPTSVAAPLPHMVLQALNKFPNLLIGRSSGLVGPSWRFPLMAYAGLTERLRAPPFNRCRVEKPPEWVILAMVRILENAPTAARLAAVRLNDYVSDLPRQLQSDHPLMEFQKEGIRYGLSRHGRCLIADEMGLGKTLQALVIAAQYREEWPALVVTPAILRFVWHEQALRWLPHLFGDLKDVEVISHGKQRPDQAAKVIIVSYGLLAKHAELQTRPDGKHFEVVLVDESQCIKSPNADRTQAVMQVCERAQRCVLLSGTPALNRPEELFTQLRAVCPGLIPSSGYSDYCSRYCAGVDRHKELHAFLTSTVMVRHLKQEVLRQLPQKLRQKIILEPSAADKKLLEKARLQVNAGLADRGVGDDLGPDDLGTLLSLPVVRQSFRATAQAKVDCVARYVEHLLGSGVKFLLFAHHHVMLDGLEKRLRMLGVGHIRIDGSTPQVHRAALVADFQSSDIVRVALLGITACGQGLTLTAASTVVFAEMYWVPGQMIQAEDRVHRIGQRQHVYVHYCIAEGTLDERMFCLLNRKYHETTAILDGAQRSMDIQCWKGSPKGMLSAPTKPLPRNFSTSSPQACVAGNALGDVSVAAVVATSSQMSDDQRQIRLALRPFPRRSPRQGLDAVTPSPSAPSPPVVQQNGPTPPPVPKKSDLQSCGHRRGCKRKRNLKRSSSGQVSRGSDPLAALPTRTCM